MLRAKRWRAHGFSPTVSPRSQSGLADMRGSFGIRPSRRELSKAPSPRQGNACHLDDASGSWLRPAPSLDRSAPASRVLDEVAQLESEPFGRHFQEMEARGPRRGLDVRVGFSGEMDNFPLVVDDDAGWRVFAEDQPLDVSFQIARTACDGTDDTGRLDGATMQGSVSGPDGTQTWKATKITR